MNLQGTTSAIPGGRDAGVQFNSTTVFSKNTMVSKNVRPKFIARVFFR
jgi:hypothetical protein